MMACNLSDPSVEIDTSWCDPIGMRATVSHLLHSRRTFIPESDVIGYPGQYLRRYLEAQLAGSLARSFLETL